VEEWYISTLTRQDYVRAVFSRQCELALDRLAAAHAALGNAIDILYVCGTDFGPRPRPSAPRILRPAVGALLPQVNDWIHRHTTWKTFKHSCGAVEPFIGRFIDLGFDILNPVQTTAAGMDRALEGPVREPDRLLGGGVNTQWTLPFGTPDQSGQRCGSGARSSRRAAGSSSTLSTTSRPRRRGEHRRDADGVREFNGT